MATDREELKRRVRERLGKAKRPEKPTWRAPWKVIAGISVTIAAFVAVLLAFKTALGWPTSLLTLGVTLAAAWFVGTAAGERLAPRWSALAALALAGGLAASTLGFGTPWEISESGKTAGGGKVAYENFLYHASFTYWGSEGNLPIENVLICLPYPNVENQTESVYFGTIWGLYWLDNENMLHLQATETTNYELKGERTEPPRVLLGPQKNPTPNGPKLSYVVDKLYPREVFMVTGGIQVPIVDADRLTLKNYGDKEGRSSAGFAYMPDPELWNYGPFNTPINVSFWAQLSKLVNDNYKTVEIFSRSINNKTYGMPWLYPS